MRSIARIALPLFAVLVIGCAQQQPAATPVQATSRWLAGAGGDSAVQLKVSLERRENGDAVVKSTVQNLSQSEIRLLYDCKYLIRLNGRRIIYDCDPLPDRRLAPGKSGLEEITVPAAELNTPTQGALVYALPGREPVTLTIPLQPAGAPGSEQVTAAGVVERWKKSGLEATPTKADTGERFGAKKVETYAIQGKRVHLFFYDDQAGAEAARKAADGAGAAPWPEEAGFTVYHNVLVAIISDDKWITKQAIIALMDPTPEQLKPLIQEDRALELARQVDPALDWAAFLYETGVDVTFRGVRVASPVWILESKRSRGGPVLFLDARTGREITRVSIAPPPESNPDQATPESVVRRFFDLTSKGQYEAAWPLLHPVSMKPVPPVPMGLVLSKFYAQEGKTGPKLKAVQGVEKGPPADGIGSKYAFCMCFLNPAKVTVELEDGTTQVVRVQKDQNGNWGILWQLRGGLDTN